MHHASSRRGTSRNANDACVAVITSAVTAFTDCWRRAASSTKMLHCNVVHNQCAANRHSILVLKSTCLRGARTT